MLMLMLMLILLIMLMLMLMPMLLLLLLLVVVVIVIVIIIIVVAGGGSSSSSSSSSSRPNTRGMTALHISAEHGNLHVARLLIRAQADVNCIFAGYATPYSLAKDAWPLVFRV